MAKSKTAYVCQSCGYESAKWYGKCPECGEWNTLVEQLKAPTPISGKGAKSSAVTTIDVSTIGEITTTEENRFHTDLSELNRVLGGGIVKGSVVMHHFVADLQIPLPKPEGAVHIWRGECPAD